MCPLQHILGQWCADTMTRQAYIWVALKMYAVIIQGVTALRPVASHLGAYVSSQGRYSGVVKGSCGRDIHCKCSADGVPKLHSS